MQYMETYDSKKGDSTSSRTRPLRSNSLYLNQEGGADNLSNWINLINAFGVTIHFEGIINDIVALQESSSLMNTGDYSWTANIGFVYVPGDSTRICIASLDSLRRDYGSGALKADEVLGQRVVTGWDPQGTMLVKEMKKLTVRTLDIQFFETELSAMTKRNLLTLLRHQSLTPIKESSTTKKRLVILILQAQKSIGEKTMCVGGPIFSEGITSPNLGTFRVRR